MVAHTEMERNDCHRLGSRGSSSQEAVTLGTSPCGREAKGRKQTGVHGKSEL